MNVFSQTYLGIKSITFHIYIRETGDRNVHDGILKKKGSFFQQAWMGQINIKYTICKILENVLNCYLQDLVRLSPMLHSVRPHTLHLVWIVRRI